MIAMMQQNQSPEPSSDGEGLSGRIARLFVSSDVQAVYHMASDFAALPPGDYELLKQRFKVHFKRAFSSRVLDRAVSQVQKDLRDRSIREQKAHILAKDGRPAVIVNHRQLADVASDSLAALVQANTPPVLYVRGDGLVRVRRDERRNIVIEIVTVPMLLDRLTKTANFYQEFSERLVDCFPPDDIAVNLLSQGQWPFPPLEAVSETPFLRPDGSVVDCPGYDRQTAILYLPSTDFPPVPASPTLEDVEKAKALLCEPIEQFPFVGDASKANWFAALFTCMLRPSIPGQVPLFAITAPSAGSGKTLLAMIPGMIASGRPVPVQGETVEVEEWRKRILSELLSPSPIAILDNLKHILDSSQLEALLTTGYYEDRSLGTNKFLSLSNRKVWIATGNNLRVGDDLRRRSVPIFLDANSEFSWEDGRFHIRDLPTWVLEHRPSLVWACLTLARFWYVSGKPSEGLSILGSFESWSLLIGGLLRSIGIPGFMENHRSWYDRANDDELAWSAFFFSWYQAYGETSVTVASLVSDLRSSDTSSEAMIALRESLPGFLADELDKAHFSGGRFQRVLGNALSKRRDLVKDGLKLVHAGVSHKTALWAITPVSPVVEVIRNVDVASEDSGPFIPPGHVQTYEGPDGKVFNPPSEQAASPPNGPALLTPDTVQNYPIDVIAWMKAQGIREPKRCLDPLHTWKKWTPFYRPDKNAWEYQCDLCFPALSSTRGKYRFYSEIPDSEVQRLEDERISEPDIPNIHNGHHLAPVQVQVGGILNPDDIPDTL